MHQTTHALQGCHVMAKPSSSKCNIDCSYCFYLEKSHLYPDADHQPYMSLETLDAYIQQHIAAQKTQQVIFAWQGGEPTLLGIAFFEKAIELQQRYNPGKEIINTMQTNGLLINDDWCQFLKRHNFLVGISIDGPKELHDVYRKTRSGKPTHDKVIAAISRLKKHKIEFNTLTVVSDANAKHPEEIYHYLKQLGSQHMQFIPLVERAATQATKDGLTLLHPQSLEKASVTPWSVDAEQYGLFMSAVFHHWVRKDIGKVWVQLFENAFALTCDQPAQLCVFAPTCGSAFALESNGDMYACDHYVYPEFKLGNIHQTDIDTINHSEANRHFAQQKQRTLSRDCQQCPYLSLCHGGCPKHRFALSSAAKPEQNYLCAGYKTFFAYSAPYLALMKQLYLDGHPPAAIMTIIARKEQQPK